MNAQLSPQDAILAILDEECRLYQRMVAAAEAQRTALLMSDLNAIALLVQEMEAIARRCEQLEDLRLTQVGRLMDPVDESFEALIPWFTSDQLPRLTHRRDRLRASVGTLRGLNDSNAGLVRQALAVTDQWTRLVRAAAPATYTRGGALTDAATGRRYTYAV